MSDWHAADAWSLGICLYIMLTGRPLYADPDDRAFDLLAQGAVKEVLEHYSRYAFLYGIVVWGTRTDHL